MATAPSFLPYNSRFESVLSKESSYSIGDGDLLLWRENAVIARHDEPEEGGSVEDPLAIAIAWLLHTRG